MSAPRAPPSLLALVVLLNAASPSAGLQPVTSASRTMLSLDGMWRLQVAGRSLTVPVPASYDQFVPGLPEGFAGVATYTRTFRVPAELCDGSHRLSLRFDSANYCATVRLDGVLLTNHSFAGMPFEAEIPAAALVGGGEHTLSVDVDNSRSWQTLPPGMKAEFHGTPVNLVWEGLYNFAGLDGRVHLVATRRRAAARPARSSGRRGGRRRRRGRGAASPARRRRPRPAPTRTTSRRPMPRPWTRRWLGAPRTCRIGAPRGRTAPTARRLPRGSPTACAAGRATHRRRRVARLPW